MIVSSPFVITTFIVPYNDQSPFELSDTSVMESFPWYDEVGERARQNFPEGDDCGDLEYFCRFQTTGEPCGDWVMLDIGNLNAEDHNRRLEGQDRRDLGHESFIIFGMLIINPDSMSTPQPPGTYFL